MKPSDWRDAKAPAEIHQANAGIKHDSGKAELDLIPTTALVAEAAALSHGKTKYGRNNYKGGFEYSRLIAACLRHLHAFKDGEDMDKESGASHLGHARACLAILIDNQANSVGVDDRHKP